jgi:predicted Rossmann-fold nucleotide-binding protein
MEDRLIPEKMINRNDLRMLQVTDDVDEVVRIIQRSYAKRAKTQGPQGGNGREIP